MSLEEAVRIARGGHRFLLAGHRRPDADALGSALGLAAVLRAMGKQALVYLPEEVVDGLRFLSGIDEVHRTLPDGAGFDATWVMDTPSPELLPPRFPSREVSGPCVVIDHHAAYEPNFGDVIVRDVEACATAEVVARLAERLGFDRFPADAAEPLYAALVSDTGGFRYPGTSAETLRLGARLLETGVDPWKVAYHLFEDWPRSRMKLLGAVLDGLQTHLDGRLATLRVPRELLERTGATEGMVEGMVNYGRMLRGVEVAALAWEQSPEQGEHRGATKVSLRSRGTVDVSRIAAALGGGGHRGAAGALSNHDLDRTLELVRDEVARHL